MFIQVSAVYTYYDGAGVWSRRERGTARLRSPNQIGACKFISILPHGPQFHTHNTCRYTEKMQLISFNKTNVPRFALCIIGIRCSNLFKLSISDRSKRYTS